MQIEHSILTIWDSMDNFIGGWPWLSGSGMMMDEAEVACSD